jgi:multisubunit Na+/H+ antiporter MnhB subunit
MKIENIKQLNALVSETYMYAIIIAIVALVLAFIIAKLIKYQGGKNPSDHVTRRIWFMVLGLVTPIAFFLYNALYVSSYIIKAPLQAKFSTANIIATLVVLGIYVVIGIISMMIMRSTQWGSILGKSKN